MTRCSGGRRVRLHSAVHYPIRDCVPILSAMPTLCTGSEKA